ncbi:MAG TPA: DegV family protein [Anaerolineaceae bacterium]|nr:DegV family protein [Anaerolineaceae bacterium]
MVNILTDSCSDLSSELFEKYGVNVIRLSVFINNRTYSDGLDINPRQIYQSVNEFRLLPKTSAPAIGEFLDFFKKFPGESIFIGIGSKLSATFQNATLAAEQLNDRKVYVVDSCNLSTGIGLLVLQAAEMESQGRSSDEILNATLASVPKIHTSFVVDTLEYIYMGGRCSAIQNIVGSMLKIRPIIEVRTDGTMDIKEKSRGTRKKALTSLLDEFKTNLPQINLHRVFITHSGCDGDAEYLKQELMGIATIEDLCITTAGATISSHCGPNTIGILYLLK